MIDQTNKSDLVSMRDRKTLFEELLSPGSLWEADCSDFFVCTLDGVRYRGITPPFVEEGNNGVVVRNDVPTNVWAGHCFLVSLKGDEGLKPLGRLNFPPKELGILKQRAQRWDKVVKGDWVMFTGLDFINPEDRENLTWKTPLRFTIIYKEKVLTTWGMDLDTWFDLFQKKHEEK